MRLSVPLLVLPARRAELGAHRATQHRKDEAAFREDLLAIARTTLSSKVLAADKDYFAELAVSAVLRLKGSTDLDHIQIIKKQGGKLTDSYLDEGFILDKKIGVNCPHRMKGAKILIANTPMDTDKIKIFGARVKVDSTGKLAELERAERVRRLSLLGLGRRGRSSACHRRLTRPVRPCP